MFQSLYQKEPHVPTITIKSGLIAKRGARRHCVALDSSLT
jgi:hypothetical protein